jgi:uroporphyrinogen-III synthase
MYSTGYRSCYTQCIPVNLIIHEGGKYTDINATKLQEFCLIIFTNKIGAIFLSERIPAAQLLLPDLTLRP